MKEKKVVFDDTKIKQATEVLKLVQKLGKNLPKGIFYLDTYQNCREAGFCIEGGVYAHTKERAFFGGEIYVMFSEYRNSDSIVVYVDTNFAGTERRNLSSLQGNVPTDIAWKNAVHFKYHHYDEAAKYIVNELKQFIKAAKVKAEQEKAKYLKELAVQKETVAFV